MEINFSKNEIKSTKRAWKIIEEINTNEDLLTDEEVSSKISIFAHKNYPYGSLLMFAIMMNEYRTALFLIEKGVTSIDSDLEIAKAISTSSETYNEDVVVEKLERLSSSIERNEGNHSYNQYREIYENDVKNYEAYKKLKELYPVKKRVRE